MVDRTVRILFKGVDDGYESVVNRETAATQKLNEELASNSESFRRAASASQAATQSASQQAQAAQRSAVAADNSSRSQGRLNQSVRRTSGSLRAQTNAQQMASAAANDASETQRAVSAQLARTARRYRDNEQRLRNLSAAARDNAEATDQASASNSRFSGVLGRLRGAILGLSLGALAAGAVSAADSMTLLQARTSLAFDSLQQTEQAISDITQIANRNAVSITAVGDLYARIAINAGDLADNQRDLREIVETVSAAFVVGGASAAEQASGILQLSQAFASGRLQGEEFRAVSEAAPPLLDLLAEATGRTRAELRELSAAGELTTATLARAFTGEGAQALQTAAEGFPDTVGRATTRLLNNARVFVAELNETLGATEAIAAGINLLANNLDTLTVAAGLAAAALAGPMIASLIASGVAFARNTGQVIAYTVALARMQGVSAASAVAQTALARSLTLLGGPIGLTITAVSLLAAGLVALAGFENENAKAVDASRVAIERLNQVQGTEIFAAAETARAKREEVMQRIANARATLAELEARQQLERRNPLRASPLGLTTGLATVRVNQQRREIEALEETLGDLDQAIADSDQRYEEFLDRLGSTGGQDAAGGAVDELKQLTDSLDGQIETLRQQLIELERGEDALLDYQEALALSTAQTDEDRLAIQQRFQAIRELNQAIAVSREEQQQQTQAAQEATQAANRVLSVQRDITESLDPLARAQNEYNDLLQDLALLAGLSDDQLAELGLTQQRLSEITRQATVDLDRQREAIRAQTDETIQALEEIAEAGIGSVSQAFGDFIASGFTELRNFRDGLLDIAQGIIADLIATFARQQIVIPIVASLAGGLGGGLGGVGGLASAFGGFLPALTQPTFATVSAAGVPIPVQTGTQLTTFGNFAAGAGLGGLAGGLLGGGTGGFLGGALGGGLGQIAGNNLLGGIFGSFGGPLGGILGGLAGGLLGGLFGGKDPRIRVSGATERFRINDPTDTQFETQLGIVRVSLRKFEREALQPIVDAITVFDNAIAQAVGDERLPALQAQLVNFFSQDKGKDPDLLNILRDRFNVIVGSLGSDIQALVGRAGEDLEASLMRLSEILAIENLVESGASVFGEDFGLRDTVEVLEEFRIEGEALTDTYNRLVNQTNAYLSIAAAAGVETTLTGEALVRFTDELVNAAGGLDVLQRQFATILGAFFDPLEVLQIQSEQAREQARAALADIGLDIDDLSREEFAEQFRAALASGDAELIANFARAGELFAQFLAIEEEISRIREQRAAEELAAAEAAAAAAQAEADANARAAAEAQAARDAAAAEEQQGLDDIAAQVEAARAAELEAIEQTREKIRERYQEEQESIEAQIAAEARRRQELDSLLAGVDEQIARETLSPLRLELRQINAAFVETTMQAIALGASEAELGRVRELQSIRLNQLAEQALATLATLVEEFTGGDGVAETISTGINQVANAGINLLDAWRSGIDSLRQTINNIRLDPRLGGLEGADRLALAQQLFDQLAARAEGGDLDALQQLPQALQNLASIAVDVEASGQDSRSIIDAAIARAEAIRPPSDALARPPNAGQVQAIGSSTDQIAENTARQAELAQQIIETLALAVELTGRSPFEIAEQLGIPLSEVVEALNINVAQPTIESVARLGLIAEQLQVGLGDLAREIGIDIGSLSDSGSLLNEALRQAITGLGPEIGEQLLPQLEALETAAGPEAQAQALSDLENLVAALAPDLRNQLAPFFDGIDVTTEAAAQTQAIDRGNEIAELQLNELALIRGALGVNPANQDAGQLPGLPSFNVGTGFVARDMTANIHRGEAIFPAPVAEFFRREGFPIRPVEGGGTGDNSVVSLLRQLLEAMENGNRETKKGSTDLVNVIHQGNTLVERRDNTLRWTTENTRGCRNGRS